VDQIAYRALPETQRESAPPYVAMVWWSLARILKKYPRPAKIHLVAKGISAKEIDRLHTRGDCFVSLTHSEGWGLGAFDALLFGKPAIVTGWGGQLDYLGPDYPLLVRYRLEPTAKSVPDGNYLHSPDAYWAHADRSNAAELMRQVYENRDWAGAIGAQWQPRLRDRFGAERVCGRLAELLGFDLRA
jgi:glycosyltransferase involved in cell wall biosynthesis